MENRCRLSHCRHSEKVHLFQADSSQRVCMSCQASGGTKPFLHDFIPQVRKEKKSFAERLVASDKNIHDAVKEEGRIMAIEKRCPNCESKRIKVHFFTLFFTGKYFMTCRQCGIERQYWRQDHE